MGFQAMQMSSPKITRWKNNSTAALTLSFDGAYSSTYRLAREILSHHGFFSTWFIVTGAMGAFLDGRPVATWEELQEGYPFIEIGSHTVTHPKLPLSFPIQMAKNILAGVKRIRNLYAANLTTKIKEKISYTYKQSQGVNFKDLLAEALESKQAIEHLLKRPVNSFAYPGGRYNSKLICGLKELGYLSSRSTDPGLNFPDNINAYTLKTRLWNNDVNYHDANSWVDEALKHQAWLIETFHVMAKDDDNNEYYYTTKVSDFGKHLAYIAAKKIWVDTQENIIKYINQRNAIKIGCKQVMNDEVVLLIENAIEDNSHNQGITVSMQVPHSWGEVIISQDNVSHKVLALQEKNGNYMFFNILPKNGEIFCTVKG